MNDELNEKYHNELGSTDLKLPLYVAEGVASDTKHDSRWKLFLLGLFTVFLTFLHLHTKANDVHRIRPYDLSRSLESRNPAYLIEAKHGAVAAENKRCSDIGVDIMKEGGNAVDAAIGAAFCTGVVNMFS